MKTDPSHKTRKIKSIADDSECTILTTGHKSRYRHFTHLRICNCDQNYENWGRVDEREEWKEKQEGFIDTEKIFGNIKVKCFGR